MRTIIIFICNISLIVSFRIKNQIRMTSNSDNSFLFSKFNIMKSISVLSLASTLSLSPLPVFALPGSLEDANTKLSSYNLPPVLFVPPGFSTVVSEYGRGNINEKMTNPLLVQFSRPQLWVTATTTVNNNGEAGTISANDYIKGDSAFFFTLPQEKQLTDISKDTIKKFVLKSLSQKGDPVDSFQISGLRTLVDKASDTTYYIADIKYLLNTQAGFVIERQGVASVTSVGPALEGLISVTTSKRYKNLESNIRAIADSFRVYPLKSGIFTAGSLSPSND